jgi:hypothetical protein
MELKCPQCGYTAENVNGSTICSYCGYTNESNGYGSLHRGNDIKLFKVPLTLVEKQNLLSSLKEEDSLYLWNDDELQVIKGQLPKKYDEKIMEQAQENNYYYNLSKIIGKIDEDIEEF